MTVQTSAAQPIPATRVSVDATGTQVAGASRQPSSSADGRLVAFSSTATTLVAGDTNGSAGAVTRLGDVCPLAAAPFSVMRIGGTIESDGPPIVVERSTYWSADGQFWAAGASALLTRLP